MTSVDTLDDCIEIIEKIISEKPNVLDLTEKQNEYSILSPSSPLVMGEDDDFIELLTNLEFSLSHHVHDDFGLIDRSAVAKLRQSGFDLVNMPESFSPFKHAVKTPKFHILVNI